MWIAGTARAQSIVKGCGGESDGVFRSRSELTLNSRAAEEVADANHRDDRHGFGIFSVNGGGNEGRGC